MTLIRVPPHSDFEQGSGHHHEELEELYIVTRGTSTMRFDEVVEQVAAGSVARGRDLGCLTTDRGARHDQGRRLLETLRASDPAKRLGLSPAQLSAPATARCSCALLIDERPSMPSFLASL